jgi:hypothetical protein
MIHILIVYISISISISINMVKLESEFGQNKISLAFCTVPEYTMNLLIHLSFPYVHPDENALA